ncbi:MAG: hypothetical protein QG614_589 [Patescibacteria group bacterium]|nr:hypothetical protein [Patescibacteria group bacterium]
MKFSIITPSYNRPELLIRAVKSILEQTYEDFELIIINDSPSYDYSLVLDFIDKNIQNKKIKYIVNKNNKGVNYSRNVGLQNISEDSDYFIFLDDDDWLDKNVLQKAKEEIEKIENKNNSWFVSNHFDINKNSKATKNKTGKNTINYLSDYLILKKFTGDAKHVISVKYGDLRFSNKVKNGEEWFYFAQIKTDFVYYDYNSSYSDGYLAGGLTNNLKNKKQKLINTYLLFWECTEIHNMSPKIFLYFILRIVAIILK